MLTNKKTLWLGTIVALISTAPAYALTDAQALDNKSAMVDTSAPIKALSKLESLKNSAPLDVTYPNIERFTTANGVPVAFVRTTALPIVDIDMRFNAGSARDEQIKKDGFGIASMTATMLTKGTSDLDEDDFTRAVETLGVNLGSRAYKDMFIVSLRSLSDRKHLTPASDLMAQMLTSPRFDEQILARNKARLMVGLEQQKQDPGALASLAFSDALYGDHPYAHPSSGTLKTVPTIARQDLIDFKNRYLVANNASLAMTGNMTLSDAKAMANKITKSLPAGQKAATLPTPEPLAAPLHIHIPFDSTQTTILMGQLGEKRATTPAAQQKQTQFAIGNEVLAGGDFNARLMSKVRQELGYTYGISGSMQPMLARGPYQIGFSTRTDKARPAIDASLEVINNTLKNGIRRDEMALTKDNLTDSFPMSFASNSGINSLLGMMQFYQLPDDYLTDYTKRIDSVTLDQVNNALRDTLKPEDFLIVTVGNENPWGTKE